jgi:hypothetical protein
MNGATKRLLLILIAVAVAVIGVLGTLHTTKVFVASCRVTVKGKTGAPLANMRVSESWNAYSYDLRGGMDIETDANGVALFPPQSSRHSVLFWAPESFCYAH